MFDRKVPHADHSHAPGSSHADHDHAGHASEKRLIWAAALTGGFMLAEIAGGLISGSLALLADAGHMFVDFAGLSLALFAMRLARRPADARRSYGYDRFQILVAYSNGLVLFGIALFIGFEAWRRLSEPVEILGGPMLAVAVGGLFVNVAAFFVLHGGDKDDMNMRGALLHVAGDLLGSLAAIAASLVILFTGWMPIDPILSVLVAVLILGNAYGLVRDSGHILLEGTPKGIDSADVGPHLRASIPGLVDIHHVHVWAITPKRCAATLHARIADGTEAAGTIRAIKREMAARFGIAHVTVEIEHDACADAAGDGTSDPRHDHDSDHGHDHGGKAEHAATGVSVADRPVVRHDHPSRPLGATA
ncbi:zinc transporter ZitB [Aureimonas sp. SA4125]|uniref:cation diffusion facilitator family transporter n=1 Tax=Aureimonas sp. SA4125 TaxID=2826993 RepID=UPI001CC4153C|nr:cation diffusion facilitator family transporter [Aureimonas sp. SA4125]BDA82663.1 zinc transporter ZitB [Aureimonas sp. SA4125]